MSRSSRRTFVLATAAVAGATLACAPAQAATPASTAARPAASPAPTAPAVQQADTGSITVTGMSRVAVATDRARIRFAVETEAQGADSAVSANAQRMERALAAVRRVLGDAGSVETSGYNLNPVYQQPPRDQGGQPRIVAYRALNHLQVTVDDVDRVGEVLDAAVQAGVNRVAALSFFASDTREARLQALRDATDRARAEAEAVAGALGMALGPVLQVQTAGDFSVPRQEMAMARTMDMAASTPVEPGEQEVSATVTVTYRLGGGGDR